MVFAVCMHAASKGISALQGSKQQSSMVFAVSMLVRCLMSTALPALHLMMRGPAG
jgi:hypothetical protein